MVVRRAPDLDLSQMKLGRKAILTDSRTLHLSSYITAALPPAPSASDWTRGITQWGMMLNDKLNCCTIASAAHAIQVFSANASARVTLSDKEVLRYYEKWNGYNPKDPGTDQGGIELNVLNNWKKSAFDKHKLLAFTDANRLNLEQVRQAIALFGGVYVGLALPTTAQTQAVWDVDPHGGDNAKCASWGGHCVFVPKYDEKTFTCITWGQAKTMTVAFWNEYVDEAHVLLSQDWITAKGAPSGFNLGQLQTDLAQIH